MSIFDKKIVFGILFIILASLAIMAASVFVLYPSGLFLEGITHSISVDSPFLSGFKIPIEQRIFDSDIAHYSVWGLFFVMTILSLCSFFVLMFFFVSAMPAFIKESGEFFIKILSGGDGDADGLK